MNYQSAQGATEGGSGLINTLTAPPQRCEPARGRRLADRPPRGPIPEEAQTRPEPARETMAATPQESSFGRGAIVRVKLFQFLTYEAVEFRPGPRLNVVMGPNGTGKSSIVMAIAVGLGAAPRQLGRADTLSEFILTGRDVAVTELELLDDEATGRTRTIERRITRSQRGTSKWKIDGKSATEPQVKELVEKDLKIQIGNLCTFLPQEKVGEFSAFDDIGLLKETEKA